MSQLSKQEFVDMQKNGVFVFHSFSCWTCSDHIENLKGSVDFFYTVEYELDVDYFESIGIDATPTTIVYKNNEKLYQKSGMLFETQINDMLRFM